MATFALPPPIDLELAGQPLGVPLPPPLAIPPAAPAPVVLPPPVAIAPAVPSIQPDETAPPQQPAPGPLLGAPAPVAIPVRAPGAPPTSPPTGELTPLEVPPAAEPQHPGLLGRFGDASAPLREALTAGKAMVQRSRETEQALDDYATAVEAQRADRAQREAERQEALQTARDTYAADLQRYQDRADEPLLSGGGKIALVIGAALHGLGAALSRGKLANNAFQIVQATLQERSRQMAAEDQRARDRLAIRRGQVEDLIDQEGELHRQSELAHAALGMKLSTELQQIGARATTEVERGKYNTLAEQFYADSLARAEKVAGDRAVAQLDAFKKRADIEKTIAETDAIRVKTAKALAPGVAKPKVLPADSDPQLRAIYARDPKEAQRIQTTGIRDPFTGKILEQPDGSLFTRAGSENEGKDLRGKMAGARKVHDLSNKLLALRAEHGFEADITKSKGWQAMQSTAGQLLLAIKDANGTGALDEGAIKVITKINGGDPTGVRDISASIETLKGNTESNLSADLRSAGFQGEFRMPEFSAPKPRTLEETRTILDRPYDPRSGSVVSAKERKAVFQEQVALKRAEVDDIVHGTELAVEDAQRLMGESAARIEDLHEDIAEARQAGDKARLASLQKSLREEREIRKFYDEFSASGAKKLEEQLQAEKRRKEARESEPTRRGGTEQ